MLYYKTIRATGNLPVAPAGGAAELWTVNVNAGAAAATLSIYDGIDATGTKIATVDATTKSSQTFGVRCPNGIFAVLAGGNADCTIGHS